MHLSLVLVLAFVLNSCGATSGGGGGGGGVDLTGTYVSDCIKLSTLYVKGITQYAGTDKTVTESYYLESSCLTLTDSAVSVKSFTIGEAVTGLTNTYKINYTFKSDTFTARTASEVTAARSQKYYGYDDWKLDVAKDTTGKASDGTADPTTAVGYLDYDILKIDGSKLCAGDRATGDGSSEAKRRTATVTATCVTKQ